MVQVLLAIWLGVLMTAAPTMALPGDAAAQDAEGEGEAEAERLAAVVGDALDGLFAAPEGGVRLARRGPVTAAPTADGYALILPTLDLETAAGSILTVGPVEAALVRRPDGRFAGPLRLPDQYALRGPAGRTRGALTVEHIDGTLAVSLRYRAVMGLTVTAENLRLTVTEAGDGISAGNLRLAEAGLRHSLSPTADGRVDSLTRLSGRGLEMRGSGEPPGTRIAAGRFQLSTGRSGLALRDWQALRNGLQIRLAGPDDAEAPPIGAVLHDIAGHLPPLFDGAYGSLAIDDLVIRDGLDRLGEERLEAVFSINGLRTATARSRFRLATRALTIDRPSEAERPPPLALTADLAVTDSPARAVYDPLLALVLLGPGDGGEDRAAPLPALIEALSAGMIAVRTLDLEADDIGVHMDGRVAPAAETRFGFAADIALEVRGFEALTGRVAAMTEGWAVTAFLTVVQAIGQREETETGETLRRYDLAIRPDGQVDLNGTDLVPLIGMLVGPGWAENRP
ncbi:MAG: hypothetical protein GVY13_00350 [Alphaproteobacteria bacterium]|jgi:hypothetical protein|nr:hypothetical protein [Alphaproteobacteria bacterium]